MARYGEQAQESVESAMHRRKHGTLRSGGSGKKVTSGKQAIAIGLSEAREQGANVPAKTAGKRSSSRPASRSTGARKRTRRTGAARARSRSATASR